MQYPALPKGLLHRQYLRRLADWIEHDCTAHGFRPDLIHAHKLTVEGITGHQLACAFRIPFVVSVQGNTDLKIVHAKPELRRCFASLWHGADIVLPFAPWASDALDTLLGKRTGPTYAMPCPGPSDQIIAPTNAPPVIRTAFHLRDHRNKNATRLIKATGLALKQVPNLLLEIIGGGDDAAADCLKRKVDRYAKGHVRFRGAVPHGRMQALLNTSAAFALVSHRESFGMVFAESLLAGTPCLIPKGRGIDGYLPEGNVTLSANPNDTAAIAAALVRLIREQQTFKARLGQYQHDGKLDFLRQPAIAQTYMTALEEAQGLYLANPRTRLANPRILDAAHTQPA